MQYLFILFILFLTFIEFTFYSVLKTAFPRFDSLFTAVLIFNFLFIGFVFEMVRLILKQKKSSHKWKYILTFTSVVSLVFFPKIFIDCLSLIENSFYFLGKIILENPPYNKEMVAKVLLFLGLIPITAFLYGFFIGRFKFNVINQPIFFNNLPKAFDGFKIVQISDIHSGSLSNKKKISNGINLINKQNADLIVFTGDLINQDLQEMEAWIETFSNIKKAKHGNFSVLGNHDYGNKFHSTLQVDKNSIIENHKVIHQQIGFNLLINQAIKIEKNNQTINLIGVENFGAPPFPQFGDLTKATEIINKNEFNVLLSHDPSHFDLEVKSFNKNISLTLSGHTHGMQFGIEFFGIKWSPVKYKYPKWAGLYKENNSFLYVNRGFGYIGVPIRIGILPEITVIILKNIN